MLCVFILIGQIFSRSSLICPKVKCGECKKIVLHQFCIYFSFQAEDSTFYEEALLMRLKDDSPKVVLTVLQAGEVSKIVCLWNV